MPFWGIDGEWGGIQYGTRGPEVGLSRPGESTCKYSDTSYVSQEDTQARRELFKIR
jgi:hypothetical protein